MGCGVLCSYAMHNSAHPLTEGARTEAVEPSRGLRAMKPRAPSPGRHERPIPTPVQAGFALGALDGGPQTERLYRVIAPSDADDTERAYFAITPRSYFGGGGVQS